MNLSDSFLPRLLLSGVMSLLILSAGQHLFLTGYAQTPEPKTAGQPYIIEYYYKARWGYADEFIRVFKKNHYPVLRKQIETGRILSVTAVRPRYHSTEDGRWDYRVTIVFKDVVAAHDATGEEGIIKQLYPDQDAFRREEQRRFEILVAHWDVPIVGVELDR
jgi:hypothetical protein